MVMLCHVVLDHAGQRLAQFSLFESEDLCGFVLYVTALPFGTSMSTYIHTLSYIFNI